MTIDQEAMLSDIREELRELNRRLAERFPLGQDSKTCHICCVALTSSIYQVDGKVLTCLSCAGRDET